MVMSGSRPKIKRRMVENHHQIDPLKQNKRRRGRQLEKREGTSGKSQTALRRRNW